MARKNVGTGLPETMTFYVLAYIERSGVQFIPADSHLRDEATGDPPDKLPSNGFCPSRIIAMPDGIKVEIGTKQCEVAKLSTIKIRIVDKETGHPYEWTPREIFNAIYPGQRRAFAKAALRPVNPHDPAYRLLIERGYRDAGKAIPRVIPPMRRDMNPVTRRFEQASPVSLTAEGAANAARGSQNPAFDFRNFEPLPGWEGPSAGPVVSPDQLPGGLPVR